MTIGQKIKSARLAHGYTQDELASKIGVQKSAIAKWETGRVQNIKRSSIKTLAEALSINPAELVGCEMDPTPATSPELEEITEMVKDMTDSQIKDVLKYIRYVKSVVD